MKKNIDNKENYANIYTTTNDNSTINPAEVELNSVSFSEIDQENKIFSIKKTNYVKKRMYSYIFQIEHCQKVKTVLYSKHKFNGIYHPKDDNHAFYIKRNKKGLYIASLEEKKETKKRLLVKNELESFISDINEAIHIKDLSKTINKTKLIRTFLILLMIIFIFSIAYNSLMLIFYLISWFVGHKSNFKIGDHTDEHQENIIKIVTGIIFIISSICLYLCVRYSLSLKYKAKYLIFKHLLENRESIEKVIEKWNYKLFYPINMKAILSDNFDYVQVFYDRAIIYEIEDHFN